MRAPILLFCLLVVAAMAGAIPAKINHYTTTAAAVKVRERRARSRCERKKRNTSARVVCMHASGVAAFGSFSRACTSSRVGR